MPRFASPMWYALCTGHTFMSPQARRALVELARNVKKNTPRVIQKLRKAGVRKPNPALVYTAAKYYDCLDRLAKENE